MSHAMGEVIVDDKTVAYFEYDGTVDWAISCLWDTAAEVSFHWRSGKVNKCVCGQPPQDVILYADYGGGFHWHGQVCFKCRAIVSGQDPFHHESYTINGRP